MADSGPFTATLRLTVGDLKVVHPITVPSAQVPASEIVPALKRYPWRLSSSIMA